jgi:hypothetical protein
VAEKRAQVRERLLFVAEGGGPSDVIDADDSDPRVSFFEDKSACKEIAFLSVVFFGTPTPPETGDSGSGVMLRTAAPARNCWA